MDLIDIYRASHLKAVESTFLSRAHGTFCRTDHILGHKANLGKYWVDQRVHLGNILQKNLNKLFGQPNIRILESYEVSFSEPNTMRLKTKHKKKNKTAKVQTYGD